MNLESFGALSFDCYGTLIDWETGILGELTPWAASHAIATTSDELLAVFSAHESAVELEQPTARYPDILAMTLERIADHFGVTTASAERISFGSSVSRWPAFADSAAALTRLHQHYELIILSNVDRASFAASNERLGVAFDLIITAEDVGSYKPSAANFRALLDGVASIGIDVPGLVHVAQSLYHDHVPAKAHGLPTVWIDRRQDRPGFGATPPPQTDVRPDWTFPSMRTFTDAATEGRGTVSEPAPRA